MASDTAPSQADVVIIGAGHNALVCAGYLAAAGLQVIVLEAGAVVGGNTATEELTLPGFQHDSCSSAHVLIQSNPVIRDDELGLCARYGLRYERVDPAVVMPLPDGDALVMHRDLDATADELARFSPADATALRALMADWDGGLATAHGRWNDGVPPGQTAADAAYAALRRRSSREVIESTFTHPVVRSLMMWLAFATFQPPDRPGTGVLPLAITSGRLRHGWATPVGGSAALPQALARLVGDHGGTVLTAARVSRILVEHGRACGVETTDGRRFTARRAVVSAAHLAQLPEMLEPASCPAQLRAAAQAWRPGLSLFAVHVALRHDIRVHTGAGPRTAVAAALGSGAGVMAQLQAFRRGEVETADPWILVVSPTVVDPDRAPDGGGTLKLLTSAPYERADGRDWAQARDEYAAVLLDRVREHADGLDEDNVLAVLPASPVDLAAHNPANLGGSCHGGELVEPDGSVSPGWRSHRSPLPGLYLTGSTTHPGGSVSGRPGRNTARVLLDDLGIGATTVMGA
ncbi:MAG TPA: NAD(P)/FAD-dependent oxidoreductase [Actinomycetes bacterium]|nr:NAD(P)/FAD-dependent oxidoreductase [Actinomycetes bacterium]